MKKINRWGVLALVVLLVLGTMSAALADDETEGTEEAAAKVAPGPGSEVWQWLDGMVTFVLYWGSTEADTEAVGFCEGLFAELVEPATDPQPVDGAPVPLSECLSVEGPNGQVNHGTFMSALVHWLKSDGAMEALAKAGFEGPKGQAVKKAAQCDFGKGFAGVDVSCLDESTVTTADDDGDHGPPPWAKNKSAKAKGPKS